MLLKDLFGFQRVCWVDMDLGVQFGQIDGDGDREE